MAIRSLKTGSFSRSTQVGNTMIFPGSYESIATTTVGAGGASSITFSSIPATFQHLQIRGIARTSTATASDVDVKLQFNSDTGSNYSIHYLYGTGSTAGAGYTSSNSYATGGIVIKDGNTTSVFNGSVVDILDYASVNKNKTVRALSAWDANGSGNIYLNSGTWFNTAAVSTITLTPWSGNFMQYSQFALYGVK